MKVWVLEKTELLGAANPDVRLFATNVPAARALAKELGRPVDLDREVLEETEKHFLHLYEREVETT